MLAHDIIIRPIITEKSMQLAEDKKYTFVVAKTANKVHTMNYRGKMKRMGRNVGRTASFKKAIVKLKDSSKTIEFFGV